MIVFAAYDSTGAIKYFVTVNDQDSAQQTGPAGGGIVALEEPPADLRAFASENYVASGAVASRSAMSLVLSKTSFTANGTDEVTITGIPAGASARIYGAVSAGPETITDGELVITSTHAGAITVSISLRPSHQDWSTTINAT
jgi:hypothetical protein